MMEYKFPAEWVNVIWVVLVSYAAVLMAVKSGLKVWWRPRRIGNHLKKQGINGPKYQFLFGNMKEISSFILNTTSPSSHPLSHNILPTVLSFYHHWKKIYGSTFVMWFGPTARITVSEPGVVKEMLVQKWEMFEKTESPELLRRIEGEEGLLNLEGHKWALHRKIILPLFHTHTLKMIIPTITKSIEDALMNLSEKTTNCDKVEMEVSQWFQSIVDRVIAEFTFGGSYDDGKPIMELQAQQLANASNAYQRIFIPGYRFVPTKTNRISWRLEKEVRNLLRKIVDARRPTINAASTQRRDDLLEVMMKNRHPDNHPINSNDVVEECKTLLFGGRHTTTNLLTWTAVLLAMHPQWQDQAREEALRVCGSRDLPDKDDIPKLKMLTMILNESLRLYPPVVALLRRAKEDVHLGHMHLLKGTEVLIPILAMHHDPTLWCHDDVHEFNPIRFAKGVVHATKHPMAFMPFGMGERKCIGQNLAMLLAKLTMVMILQRFTIELSPSYKHSPAVQLILHPQHGAPIVFHRRVL